MAVSKLNQQQEAAIKSFEKDFNVMHALADRNRQKIIVLLAHHLDGGLTVTSITERMAITQPAVSHHLKILRDAGIVSFHKKGLQSVYYLTLKEPLKGLEQSLNGLRTKFEK